MNSKGNLGFCLKIASTAAEKAGHYLMKQFRNDAIQVHRKNDETWVTEADIKSEKIILEHLKKETPDFTVLAEESSSAYSLTRGYKWIIDPLDGTPNYARGIPLFSVSIGLEMNGEIILGVLYLPSENLLLSAVKGHGAYAGKRRLSVSRRLLKDSILASETYFNRADVGILYRFVGKTREVRIFNSACTVLAYLALGRIDGCIDRVDKPWDWAAGSLIVREAGGKVTNFKGQRVDLYQPSYVAANSLNHKEIVQVLSKKRSV
ncbi:MAG: inositol monophosphatase family protein [Patescibacteria group bacterium]